MPHPAPDELRRRIRRRRDFESRREEAYLELLLASSLLESGVSSLLKTAGLSQPAYNALRILSGEDGPLTCSEIRDRMVARAPDITRLVDQLLKRGFVSRERSSSDRRVVRVAITPDGRAAIAGLDRRLIEHHDERLSHLSDAEAAQLIRLLRALRTGVENQT